MDTVRILGRNILSNWSGFAIHVIITLAITPFIINSLGTTIYGIWALVIGITGYYGLLDLGVRAGLTQYISRYLARGELDKVNATASTGFVVLLICGAFLAVLTIGLAWYSGQLFDIPDDNISELRLVILIVGFGICLEFPLFPFSAIFPATERFDISNGIGIFSRLLFAGATYVVLETGHGLIGLCIVATGTNLLDYMIRLVVAYRLIPSLKVNFHLVEMSRAREFARFGVWNTAIHGSARLISYTDVVVIGVFLPLAAITPFAIVGSLIEYFMRLFIPIGQVFFPRFTALDAKGDEDGIRELFLNGTRLLAILACPAGLVTFWFANDFLELWIGDAVAEGVYPSSAALYSILVVAAVFSAVQRVTYQVFLGTRRLKMLAAALLAEAIANLVLSIALIERLGLVGVALGTLIPAIIVEGFLLPIAVCRIYTIQLSAYFLRVYGPALMLIIALLPVLLGINELGGFKSWGRLVIEGGVIFMATVLLIPWMGLSKHERSRFVWQPISRLRSRIKGHG